MTKRQLIIILLAVCALGIFAFSIYDIANDKGWTLMTFLFYALILVPLVSIFFASRTDVTPTPTTPPVLVSNEKQFRCPSCHQAFSTSVPTMRPVSFTHVCPKCGYLGTITLKEK